MPGLLNLRRALLMTLVSSLPLVGTGVNVLKAKESKVAAPDNAMRAAAVAFLEKLEPVQRKHVMFELVGPERTDWHFVPKDRLGLSFKEMTLDQRRVAHKLLRSVLSEKGYFKATTIMSLESVLRELEADRKDVNNIRDPEKYWFALFGNPQGDQPWGWRVEGHHLSLNFTSIDGLVVSATPLFLGSNPAEVRTGARAGLRVLGNEEDLARDFLASLTPKQQSIAIISNQVPRDVLTVPGEPLDLGKPAGIAEKDLTQLQQQKLTRLLKSFLGLLRSKIAKQEYQMIDEAGTEKIHFAWMGSLDPDKKHYFRLHGPTFILEYDNAQGNHAHLVYHSTNNDFGADALRRHYETSPHHHSSQ